MPKFHVTFQVRILDDDHAHASLEDAVVGVSVEAPTKRDAAWRFQQVLQRLTDGGRWVHRPGILVPPSGGSNEEDMSDGLTDVAKMTKQAQEDRARFRAELAKADPEGKVRASAEDAFRKLVTVLGMLPGTEWYLNDLHRIWERYLKEAGSHD